MQLLTLLVCLDHGASLSDDGSPVFWGQLSFQRHTVGCQVICGFLGRDMNLLGEDAVHSLIDPVCNTLPPFV